MTYMLVFLATKRLPWHKEGFNIRDHKKEISQLKLSSSIEDICQGEAAMFKDILKSFYKMNYDEEPDYGCILFMFEKILLEEDSVPHSNNYDWVQN
jgi:hypothetical protein